MALRVAVYVSGTSIVWLLLLHSQPGAPASRTLPGAPRVQTARPGPLAGVSMTCSSSELLLRADSRLYGGRLTLGRSCPSNGVDPVSGELLFRYPLTACGGRRQLRPAHLLYRFVLRHTSRRAGIRSWGLECRLNRHHHVFRVAVKPTWFTPTRKILRSQLAGYQIQQMNADWTARHPSDTYSLGQRVNLQISTLFLHPGGKLYVDYCYATPSEVPWAPPKHIVVGNFGCMVENVGFFVSRTHRSINFSFNAFQFTHEPTSQIFLHCKLFVMAGGPSPTAKSCSYNVEEERWKALSGADSICDCCESTCTPFKGKRSMSKGLQSSGPLVFTREWSRPQGTVLPTDMLSHFATLDVTDDHIWAKSGDMVWQGDYDDMKEEELEILQDKNLTPREVCRGKKPSQERLNPFEKFLSNVSYSLVLGVGEAIHPSPPSRLTDKLVPSSGAVGTLGPVVDEDYSSYGLLGGVGEVMVLSDYYGLQESGGDWLPSKGPRG